jgi:hypothetical protein
MNDPEPRSSARTPNTSAGRAGNGRGRKPTILCEPITPPTGEPEHDDVPDDRRIFRLWIEVRAVSSGELRCLPLAAFRRIPLVRTTGAPPPSEVALVVTDDPHVIEAATFEELVGALRALYPDGAYERRLCFERDHTAERARSQALHRLVDLLAEAAYRAYEDGESTG